VSEYQIVLEYI